MISSFLLISLAYAQVTSMVSLEEKVLGGRVAIEKYRASHDSMYDEKGMKGDRHSEYIGVMLNELEVAGYIEKPLERLDAFQKDNMDYNAKELGFEDFKDFYERANHEEDVTNFLNSWK